MGSVHNRQHRLTCVCRVCAVFSSLTVMAAARLIDSSLKYSTLTNKTTHSSNSTHCMTLLQKALYAMNPVTGNKTGFQPTNLITPHDAFVVHTHTHTHAQHSPSRHSSIIITAQHGFGRSPLLADVRP